MVLPRLMSYVCKTPFFKFFLINHNNHHLKVDLRSDTVTKPSPAMRQAMANAEVLMMMQIHSDDNACSIMHILDTFHVYMKRLKGNHKKTFSFADSASAEYCSTFLRVSSISFGLDTQRLYRHFPRPAESDPYVNQLLDMLSALNTCTAEKRDNLICFKKVKNMQCQGISRNTSLQCAMNMVVLKSKLV